MNFGILLKELRTNRKLTQQQLAERLGVEKSIISYYENGDRYPSYDILIKIARTFRVTTDYLLGLEQCNVINVSDLSPSDIAVLSMVADAFREKQKT